MKKLHIGGFFLLFAFFILYPAQAQAEKTVILDPGHGGRFSGTTGYSGISTGYYEKHFNLEMSKEIKEELEAAGYDVHITRTDDSHFAWNLHDDLQARLDIAHDAVSGSNDNAIFLSVHSNALPSNPYMRGYETYFFDIDEGINRDYPPSEEQIKYSPESKRLAYTVHEEILDGTPLSEGRGLVPSDLYVTRNAHMPAALLEFGYMSNPDEEALIKTSSFQQKAAEAVVDGVNAYFRVYEVYDADGERLEIFYDRQDAIDFAEDEANVYVLDKYTREKIYDNTKKRYGAYHSNQSSVTKLFVKKDDAIDYADDWKNMRVVDNEAGEVVWSNYLNKDYVVEHSNKGTLYESYNLDDAVAYAGKWKNTSVVDQAEEEVVWSNYLDKDYTVSHSNKGELKSFYREQEAVAYAKQWKNTEVVNDGRVIWSNMDDSYSYSFETNLLAGKDRIKTAIEVSKQLYPNGLDGEKTVVLATAFEFADALSAGPLAAQYDNAPILLNRDDELSDDVKQELQRLHTEKVVILGGTNAISEGIEQELGQNYNVDRISGSTRIETNLEINENLKGAEGVFVASSTSFPDALEASSVAAANGWSIVLTGEDEISSDSLNYLTGKEVVILGGTAVVSEDVEKQLVEANGADRVERLSGATRYETVAAALQYFQDDMNSDTVLAATGKNYPDALTASALSARTSAPLVLVGDKLNPELEKQLDLYGGENVVEQLQIIGAVVDESSQQQIADHLN
ncbi:hypothetical protein GLW03_19475 [Halobacillus halophilus]|uniref:cell wall-binding repeat-containing protein n=1 Tax=Halobacillus halophilus TaxID=1570 RepID=UPI0013698007|nr:cell wall-binding repeat-containing protein [Halobacillus halophilus]MYL31978.1 hypothetical protein [Halobacillus halophilus]